MIKDNEPLSMVEVAEYVGKIEDSDAHIISFIKKFTKLAPKKAKELRGKIEELGLMKVRKEHVIKIIDLMPESQEDLNKIFSDVGLNEDEAKKILETIKEFK